MEIDVRNPRLLAIVALLASAGCGIDRDPVVGSWESVTDLRNFMVNRISGSGAPLIATEVILHAGGTCEVVRTKNKEVLYRVVGNYRSVESNSSDVHIRILNNQLVRIDHLTRVEEARTQSRRTSLSFVVPIEDLATGQIEKHRFVKVPNDRKQFEESIGAWWNSPPTPP